jgi:hypothetical protein
VNVVVGGKGSFLCLGVADASNKENVVFSHCVSGIMKGNEDRMRKKRVEEGRGIQVVWMR